MMIYQFFNYAILCTLWTRLEICFLCLCLSIGHCGSLKLMASGLNRTAVNNCLQTLKNYAAEDKGMKVFFSLYFFLSLTLFFFTLDIHFDPTVVHPAYSFIVIPLLFSEPTCGRRGTLPFHFADVFGISISTFSIQHFPLKLKI